MKNIKPHCCSSAPCFAESGKSGAEERCEAVTPPVTPWWLNAGRSYQQLLPRITCNYKWPWAADEEPIRFQLACQPKTNYLLALTAGFYLHNSNPSAYCLQICRLQPLTRSCVAGLSVDGQRARCSPAASPRRETRFKSTCDRKCDHLHDCPPFWGGDIWGI